MFRLLRTKACRTLGDAAYSIYLLHGLLMYILFAVIFDRWESATWTAWRHWWTVAALTPCTTLISLVTYRLIEHPAIGRVEAVTGWLKCLWRKRPVA